MPLLFGLAKSFRLILIMLQGYEALGGMSKVDAQKTFARLKMAPHLFGHVWSVVDVDEDSKLNQKVIMACY